MSTDFISPLRQRMIEDMNARKLCAAYAKGPTSAVADGLLLFLKHSPDTASGGGHPPVPTAPS